MNKNNLIPYMKKKGISVHLLSEMTEIPATTLSRIVNNKVKTIKPKYIDAISEALQVPPHAIFDITVFNEPLLAAIRPEDAGTVITKMLSEDESLLLYLYQTSSMDARMRIMSKAKFEAQLSQKEIYEKDVIFKERKNTSDFEQLSLKL